MADANAPANPDQEREREQGQNEAPGAPGEGEELPGAQRGSLGETLSIEFVVASEPPGDTQAPTVRFEVSMALIRAGAFIGGVAGMAWAHLGTEGAIEAARADGRATFGYADVELELEARDFRAWLVPTVLPGGVRGVVPYVLQAPPPRVLPVVELSCFDPAAPLRARSAVLHGLRAAEPRGLPVRMAGQLGELARALREGRLMPLLHVNGRVVSLDDFHTASVANGLPALRKDVYPRVSGTA